MFNHCVCLDLMKLKNKTVIEAVDKDTNLSAAWFLKGESTKEIWDAFVQMSVSLYVGFPEISAYDQSSQFASNELQSILAKFDIPAQRYRVDSFNVLRVDERYHSYLRRIYDRICLDST